MGCFFLPSGRLPEYPLAFLSSLSGCHIPRASCGSVSPRPEVQPLFPSSLWSRCCPPGPTPAAPNSPFPVLSPTAQVNPCRPLGFPLWSLQHQSTELQSSGHSWADLCPSARSGLNKAQRGEKRDRTLICSVCRFLWYKYSPSGWYQPTNATSPDTKSDRCTEAHVYDIK